MTDEVLIGREGAAGVITLNRPEALNALTLDMCRVIHRTLDSWRDNPAVQIVIIEGAGDKAFCAGGDVRYLYDSGKARDGGGETFWREEYLLNSAIKHYPKPYAALIDGYTMGGGVGLSVHGSHKVMTDRTVFAMPETGIGLFPDVGGTFLLSHGAWNVGTYLGLTGARCTMGDVIYAGGADVYVPSDRLSAFRADLTSAAFGDDPYGDVDAIIDQYADDVGDAPLRDIQETVDQLFCHNRMEDIVAALESDGSEWCREVLKELGTKSPTSLKVTLSAFRRARPHSLDWCLDMELRLSCRFIRGHDFFEGVRSIIIDKDHAFNWSPATLEEVSDEAVEAYFEPLPDGRELGLA